MTEFENRSGVGSPDEEQLSKGVREYVLVARKYWWVVLLTLVVGVAGAFFYTSRQPKIYEATSSVVIDPQPPQVFGNQVQEVITLGTGSFWSNKEYYNTNTRAYLSKLDSLDLFVREKVSEIPNDQRILVTAHDAFQYFGDAYDMRVEGLQGISTVADFGLRDIANLIDLIIENQIKAIFVETSVSSKSIDAVITGCKEKGHEVAIGGYLYSDAMGELGTDEGTYIGMVERNINTIVDALK